VKGYNDSKPAQEEEIMKRKYVTLGGYLLVIFLLCLIVEGCSFFRYMDGSSKEGTKRFHTSNEKLWAEFQSEKEKFEIHILELEYRLAQSDRQIKELEELVRSRKGEIQRDAAGSNKDVEGLKIKVLSGNGDINSAQKMASRLKKMGYKIKLVDHAPTPNFTSDTVFYALRSQGEGEALVGSLGGDTVLKFISWPSAYDLMVVTGKNDKTK